MIKFNGKDTKEIYIGDKAISEVYHGDKLVWSKKPKVLDWSKFFYGLERVVISRPNSSLKTYYYKVNIDSSFKDIKPITIKVELLDHNTAYKNKIKYTGQSTVKSRTFEQLYNFGYIKFIAIYNGKEVAKVVEYGDGY